uniref:NADH-ubiquinone oxidoreductase chain 4L n=1 Tax=Pseudacysta perseae TaxID=1041453 RepID=A0A089RZX2_PSEPZ|nr:NADH dehydrogenase subunit 4L [Pseudacysta perseae]AIR11950.1 NADH dehydrogenase subunit 4L [Pseudacysta perseae]
MLFSLYFSFLCGLMVMFSMRNHLLLTLISVEFIMIIVYSFMFMNFMSFNYEMYFLIMFLVMLVCEGSLGLSILVGLIRCHGNDMVSSLLLILW